MLHIVIPGEPEALARPRAFRTRKGIGMYDPNKSHKWQMKQIFLHALTNYVDGDTNKSRVHFDSGAYDVIIRLYCTPPSSLPKRDKIRLSWGLLDKTTKSDIDNFCKMVFDAGNQTLWHDDAQIVSVYVKKYFCNDGNPRTELWVMPRKQMNAEDLLAEVDMDEVESFCQRVGFLNVMLQKYKDAIRRTYEPDELYASEIAFHLTKIVDEHGSMLKRLDKHKKMWQKISAETPVPGEGKILC